MKQRFHCLFKFAALLLIMLSAEPGMAKNLLGNSGFEEQSAKTNFPLYWVKASAYKGDISVISDALEAHRGSFAVKVGSVKGDAAIISISSWRLNKHREVSVTLWAKGDGIFSAYCYMYGKRSFLGSVKSKNTEVQSEQWKKYELSVQVPTTAGRKNENVNSCRLALHVSKGAVIFDDVELQVVDQTQKKAVKKAPARSVKNGSEHPYIHIPKVSKAPVINGKFDKNEWKNAAAITGFMGQGVCKLSPQQSVMYASYDDKNLYFALKSVVTGPFKKGQTGRDNIKINGEAFEIWVSPKEKQWFQFLGVPAGGYYDISAADGIKWDGGIKYVSHFEDSGETAGGILTFNKTFWTAEVAIPLKNMGITSPPAKGTVWRVNFCRDLAEINGKARTVEQWTTWSPSKNHFTDTRYFGYAGFGGDDPAVQLLGLGDPHNGLVNINGTISSGIPGNVKLSSAVKVLNSGKTLWEKELTLPVKGEKTFALGELIKLSRTADLVLEFTATDPAGTQKYASSRIPFSCASSFDVKVIPVYSKGFADIELNTSRVAGISNGGRISVAIDNTGIAKEKVISAPGTVRFRVDISKLKKGDYTVKSRVVNRKNQLIVSSAMPLTIPEKPAWLGNKIGLSNKVPAPWAPIRTSGKNILITDRRYTLGDNGLPEQISALGKNIFNGKPAINIVSGGRKIKMTFEPVRKISGDDTKSVWAVKGSSGKWKIEGTLCTEYDGFTLYKFAITPLGKVAADAVYMDFPIKKEIAMYVRASTELPDFKNCNASLYKEFASAKPVDLAGKWLYNPGWIWDKTFFNAIWVGDDKIGFSLLTESDENINGKKQIEFISGKDTTVMRVNLISTRTEFSKPLKYEYAWQATPVKPETKDPKKWHAAYFGSWPENVAKRLYVGAQYSIISPSYPKLKNPVTSLLRDAHKHGAKVVPDIYLCAAQFGTPEYKLYGSEWEVTPRQSWSNMGFAASNSSYPDFMLHTVKCYVEKFGLDGIYLDVSMPVASDNPYHDAGYTKNGKRYPTAMIWSLRELYKRLYTYLHTNGKDGVIFAHAATIPAFAGFADVMTVGEEWGADREKLYTRLSPDMFRTKEMHVQYGIAHTFYSFHQYSWRVNKPVSLEEILMMTLPHRVLPTLGDKRGGQEIVPVWDIMDQWFTSSDFIPYWNVKSPVRTGSESVLASVYNKPEAKQALVVVSNWGYKADKANLAMDFGGNGKVKITELYPGNKPVAVNGKQVILPMKSRGLKIIRVDY